MTAFWCPRCSSIAMFLVGRIIKPGHSEIWSDGFICPTRGCSGYGTVSYDGSVSKWPALTLMDDPLSAMMRGAMKFRDHPGNLPNVSERRGS